MVVEGLHLNNLMWVFEDARMPTEEERKHLSRLMYIAFCDLRALARDRKIEQARDLADTFHNIPLLMNKKDFSFQAFKGSLNRYQEKYGAAAQFDYWKEWEKLASQKDIP